VWPPLLHNRPALPALCLLAANLAFAPLVSSQETAPTPTTVEEALQQIAAAAGVIFVGEVTAIKWRQGENGSFRVDDAVLGCAAGSTYKLNEWAGLWAGGDPRYRVGQRLLMLLHPPGVLGVSSPVGGTAGAIPIRGTTPSPQMATGSTAQTAQIADLRWVGTRLLRAPVTSTPPIVTGSGQVDGSATPSTGDSSIASQQAPVSVVVSMLRSWQTAQ